MSAFPRSRLRRFSDLFVGVAVDAPSRYVNTAFDRSDNRSAVAGLAGDFLNRQFIRANEADNLQKVDFGYCTLPVRHNKASIPLCVESLNPNWLVISYEGVMFPARFYRVHTKTTVRLLASRVAELMRAWRVSNGVVQVDMIGFENCAKSALQCKFCLDVRVTRRNLG